jgi:hypothetical protein
MKKTAFDPSAHTPTKKAFPRSWKSWRRLRAGEKIRRGDRVAWTNSSLELSTCIGTKIAAFSRGRSYVAGWYWRRTS